MLYEFTTVITEFPDEDTFIADVPDMRYCTTSGKTFEEALDNVNDALSLTLVTMEDEGIPIPDATNHMEMAAQYLAPCVRLIIDTDAYRAFLENMDQEPIEEDE